MWGHPNISNTGMIRDTVLNVSTLEHLLVSLDSQKGNIDVMLKFCDFVLFINQFGKSRLFL